MAYAKPISSPPEISDPADERTVELDVLEDEQTVELDALELERRAARFKPPETGTQSHRLVRRLILRAETWWVCLIVALAGVVHAINMFGIPYYENDEGTYMSQAWAVLQEHALAPYTYIYDHAPLGWIQIAAWVVIVHGFGTFGNAINTGRVLMLLFQLGSTWMVYRIARNVSGSVITASLAALLFALSPFAIYYHRRVLLDNIATFWMLLSILLLVGRRLTLTRVWLSALALGVAILSKEVAIFVIPALAVLVGVRSHRSNRWFAVTGWLTLSGACVSLYILMAILKGELFPVHTLLGGSRPHVSLITTLLWQASRSKDGGIMDIHSRFWQTAHVWVNDEPLLVIGGTFCALISLLLLAGKAERARIVGALGLATLGVWLFMIRGGEVLDFYLVPAIPLLALNVALVMSVSLNPLRLLALRYRGWLAVFLRCTTTFVALAAAAITLTASIEGGLHGTALGYAYDPELLWTVHQTTAQEQAISWVEHHVAASRSVVVDDYMWTDLHDKNGGRAFRRADWYWKLGFDPAIEDGIYHNRWQNIDYIVTTPQLLSNVVTGPDASSFGMLRTALRHSKIVAHFESDDWTVNVRKVIIRP